MSGKRLFMGPTPHQVTRASEESALRMIRSFTEDQLRANSLEDLVQAVIDDKVAQPIVLDVGNHRISNGIVPSGPGSDEVWASIYRPASPFPDREAIEGSLYIPYTGTRQAFDLRPNRMPVNLVEGSVTGGDVILSVVVDPDTPPRDVEERLLTQERHLMGWVTEVNRDIAALEQYIRGVATRQLRGRLDVIKKRGDMAAAFSIPVREVEPERALDVPVKRTAVVLKAAPGPGASGEREWRLDKSIYERMIETITKFGHALERRPRSAQSLIYDEETIRDWLMFNLSTNYEAPDGGELFIGGEVENGKGKTDILVRHQNRNVFIAECKFWQGPKKFDDAIEQLLGYTTWRDTKAAIILFITNKNAIAAIDSAGGRLAVHAACKETLVSAEPYERRDYRFTSPDDNQRVISLALLPVIVPKTQSSANTCEV
jgi:hypothetical protein